MGRGSGRPSGTGQLDDPDAPNQDGFQPPVGVVPAPPGNSPGEAPVRAFGLMVEQALRQDAVDRNLANQIENWLDAMQKMLSPFKDMLKGPAVFPANPTSQQQPDSTRETPATIAEKEEAGPESAETPPQPEGQAETALKARFEAADELFGRMELLPARIAGLRPAVREEDQPENGFWVETWPELREEAAASDAG